MAEKKDNLKAYGIHDCAQRFSSLMNRLSTVLTEPGRC